MSRTDVHTKLKHIDDYYKWERSNNRSLSVADVENITRYCFRRAMNKLINGDTSNNGGFEVLGKLTTRYRKNNYQAPVNTEGDAVNSTGERMFPTDVEFNWEADYIHQDKTLLESLLSEELLREFSAYTAPNFYYNRRGMTLSLPNFVTLLDKADSENVVFLYLVDERDESAKYDSYGHIYSWGKTLVVGEYMIISGPRHKEGTEELFENDRRYSRYSRDDAPMSYEEESKHYPSYYDDWGIRPEPTRNSLRMEHLDAAKEYNSYGNIDEE